MVSFAHYTSEDAEKAFGEAAKQPVEFNQGDKVQTPDGIGFVSQTGIRDEDIPVRVQLVDREGTIGAYFHDQVELIARTSEEPPAGSTVQFAIHGKPSEYSIELKIVRTGWQLIDTAKNLEVALAVAAGHKFGPFWDEAHVAVNTVEIYELTG